MKRAGSAFAAAAVLAFAASGCGGSSPTLQRTLDTFLAGPKGATWAARFPHEPGSRACTAFDPKLKKRVAASCSTALSLGDKKLVLATFTVSWNHGSSAHTWFVFLHANGTVDHVTREGEATG